MIDGVILVATLVSAIGGGLVAGLFFAFSACVMTALGRRLPAAHGIAAMQAINVAILNPVFLLLFVGTTASSVLLAVTAPFGDEPGAIWRLVGGVLFVVGAFLVTVVCNVPLNDALAKVDPVSSEGARVWERYLARWTAWNHVRTLAAGGAATILTLALRS